MNKIEVVVASKNKGKVAEIEKILGALGVSVLSLADFAHLAEAPETGKTFAENACQKALYYAKGTGKLCLADDSGLAVDALDGEPGIYSARYAGNSATDKDNNLKLLAKMRQVPEEKRGAKFCCVVALARGDEILATAAGEVAGVILTEARGAGGFGYDPLFLLPEGKTMAELESSAKNKISHRGVALRKLAKNSVWEKLGE